VVTPLKAVFKYILRLDRGAEALRHPKKKQQVLRPPSARFGMTK
jgi:hypothetical protein